MTDASTRSRTALVAEGCAAVGLPGRHEAPGILAVLRHHPREVAGTFLATVAAWLPFGAAVALGPVLADHLGLPNSATEDIAVQMLLLAALLGMGSAAAIARRPGLRRALIATAAVGGVGLLITPAGGSQAAIVLTGAVALGASVPVLRPTAVEATVVGGRNRVVNALHLGAVTGVALPAAIANGADVSTVLSTCGLAGVAMALAGTALVRPPAPGTHDEVQVRRLVDADHDDEGRHWGFREAMRRAWARTTLRRALAPVALLGLAILPMPVLAWFLAMDRAGVALDGRGDITLGVVVTAVVFTLLAGIGSDHRFARDGGTPLRRAAVLVAVAGALSILAALTDQRILILLAVGTTTGTVAIVLARFDVAIATGVPAGVRPHALALVSITSWLGAVVGLAILAGVDSRFGPAWAVGLVGVALLGCAVLVHLAARSVRADVEQTIDRLVGHEELAVRRRAGEHIPLLQASGIDFAYGQVQVLFGVDFTVDEGEMVALLGTNGAGKSTLLRVVSGLGQPSRGTVRFDGQEITFWRPAQRVHAGITQIPGGKAVFAPMSVVENLRVYGYALGRDRAAVDAGIDKALELFPRLDERRNQLAGTLSGGEQQMLALSKALILQPRLLCIDELSLGLAPRIVADLLGMVREINAQGTAIVLVEQSVNVALSLVDHAYYMEKGEVRFDGRASDLLERPDILRSVYLKGAAAGLGAGSAEGDTAASNGRAPAKRGRA